MHFESFQLKLINFLNRKNCKRLFILCSCMFAFIFGFQNYKSQKTFSSKADSINPTETEASSETTTIKSNTTSTSLKK